MHIGKNQRIHVRGIFCKTPEFFGILPEEQLTQGETGEGPASKMLDTPFVLWYAPNMSYL